MKVTKSMLENYRAGKMEIIALEKYLDKLEEDKRGFEQTDIVKGSSTQFPYLPITVRVSGVAPEDMDTVDKIKNLQRQTEAKIWQKKLALERQKAAVERWLEKVADPNIRSLVRLHYIIGLSWEEVCRTLAIEGDGSTQRKQMDRFWKSYK